MSERIRKGFAIVLVVALAVAMISIGGCKPKTTTEGEGASDVTKGGTFRFALGNIAFIDPVNLQESEGTQVGQAVFDSLVAFDPITSAIVPAAAESWEPNDDASVWTFHLVKGAKFHNGREVTAEDFKYAWERICNPVNESEIAYHLAPVKGYTEMQDGTATELSGVKAIDDLTLEVTLTEPFADFEFVVGHPGFAPVPKEEVEKDPAAFADMPVGNGPFKMAEPWAHDQYVKVVKFDDYYGTKPNIDGIDFIVFADDDTAWLEYQAGNLDFCSIPVGQIESTKAELGEAPDGYTANPGQQVYLGAEQSTYYYVLNNTDPILKNADLRKALSLAINRQAVCDKIFEGTRVPATGIVPPGMVGYKEGAFPYAKYDVEAAKQMLATAGYPEGAGLPAIKLQYNTESPAHADIAQLVQADLKVIGVNCELSGMEWAQYLDYLSEKTYNMGRLGWQADYPTAYNFLNSLFVTGGSDNYSGYSNGEVDKLLKEVVTEADSAKRGKTYEEIEALIGEDAPVIPMMYYRHTRVASSRVHEGTFSPNGLFTFTKVWLEDETAGK